MLLVFLFCLPGTSTGHLLSRLGMTTIDTQRTQEFKNQLSLKAGGTAIGDFGFTANLQNCVTHGAAVSEAEQKRK